MARKDKIRRIDSKRAQEKQTRMDEIDEEARQRTQHLLERAENMKLEEAEEIKKCNKLILETKCRAIRDAQVNYKKKTFFTKILFCNLKVLSFKL